MIIYDGKKWWAGLVHFHKSYIIKKSLKAVLLIGIFSAIIVVVEKYLYDFHMKFDTTIYSLLGIMLSLLMVFRLNSSYDRWWEGRKQWGLLINKTRFLAIMANRVIPKTNHHKFALIVVNYCYALRDHLRDQKDYTLIIEYDKDYKQGSKNSVTHIPNKIVNDLYATIQDLYNQKLFDGFEYANFKAECMALLDIQGACERIKATPIPYAHNFFIKLFISTYCILLPMILAPTLDWYAIPITMFVSYALVGIEYISAEVEEPFGMDCNDLPTSYIAQNIHRHIFEIFDFDSPKIRDKEPQSSEYAKLH